MTSEGHVTTKKRKPTKSKRTAAKRSRVKAHHAAAPKPATVLVLRTCDSLGRGHGGFEWPESGHVECADWDPTDRCGGGLHGLLWGEGRGLILSWEPNAKWLVVEVVERDIVQITADGGGKVKFPRGVVVHCGDRASATTYIAERSANRAIVGGAATAGEYGTATAGDRGTATAGEYGIATAGDRGTATAGEYGTVQLSLWDDRANRHRIVTGYVGEDGIKAGTKYQLVDGKLTEVK